CAKVAYRSNLSW
nr:immunoglobulin heavy chain junction region [Macaca mulatta]